jgi:hypothetical protein
MQRRDIHLLRCSADALVFGVRVAPIELAIVPSSEAPVTKLSYLLLVGVVMFLPHEVRAQQAASDAEGVIAAADQNQQNAENQQVQAQPQQEPNVPQPVRRAEREVTRAARRFNLGVQGGAGLDPEILDVGVHASFGPVFNENLAFRPVFEVGAGELTTILGVNLDVLYTFPGFDGNTRWMPYVGAGPQFGLSHQGFETNDLDNVNVDGVIVNDRGRFDFSDTDFNGGMNFIVGMKRQSGAFFEMKGTAWGVSSIRLLAGFNFYGRGGSPQ